MDVPGWGTKALLIAGWFFVALGVIGLVGHAIRPVEWPEVPSLGKAGGFVLDAISLAFGAALLILGKRTRRTPSQPC